MVESAVNKHSGGKPKHQITTEDWKRVPDWIENPVAAFRSQDGSGRVVLFAPDLVGGRPVRIILDPNSQSGGLQVHVAVNAYDESGTHITPVEKWVKNGDLLYLDQKRSPELAARSGLQLPRDVRQLRGYKNRVFTEADLVNYRAAKVDETKLNQSAMPSGEPSVSAFDLATQLENEFDGLKLDLLGRGKYAILSRIVLPKEGRQQGVGTEVMDRIVAWADQNGVTVSLSPSGDFGGNKARLAKFYKRFGFVENKGKARDFEISEAMYRTPVTTLNQSEG